MITLAKIFNYPFTITPHEATVEVEGANEAIMNWLDQHKIDPNNIIKIYIAERKVERLSGASSPMVFLPRIVARMDAPNSYREREIDIFGGWYNTLQAMFEDRTGVDIGFSSGLEERLKYTIEAMNFVELELADGRFAGFNPRKFTVLERDVVYSRYSHSHVADEDGYVTAVKGYHKDLKKTFDDHKLLMQSAEADREQLRQAGRYATRAPA